MYISENGPKHYLGFFSPAPPLPGWPPVSRVPLTCRRSVAGCHIFQPRGFGSGDAGRLCESRREGEGAAVPLSHLGSTSAGGASWRRPQPVGTGAASGTKRRSAAGNLWAPLRPPVGAQLRRLRSSARAPAPRPLPPPPSTIRTCAL